MKLPGLRIGASNHMVSYIDHETNQEYFSLHDQIELSIIIPKAPGAMPLD